MTISGTVASALSGLTVAARAAELVSSNVANARTEGYARRSLEVAPRAVGASGQGVQVVAVLREALACNRAGLDLALGPSADPLRRSLAGRSRE